MSALIEGNATFTIVESMMASVVASPRKISAPRDASPPADRAGAPIVVPLRGGMHVN